MYGTNVGQLRLQKMDQNSQLVGSPFWTYPSECKNSKTIVRKLSVHDAIIYKKQNAVQVQSVTVFVL